MTSAKLLLADEHSETPKKRRIQQQPTGTLICLAEVISEADVCGALCIPPIYTENFDQKHFTETKNVAT